MKKYQNLIFVLGGFVGGNLAQQQLAKVVNKDNKPGLMQYAASGAVAAGSVFGMTKVQSPAMKMMLLGSAISGGYAAAKQGAADLKINIPGLSGVDGGEQRTYFRPNFPITVDYTDVTDTDEEDGQMDFALPEGFEYIPVATETPVAALPARYDEGFEGASFGGLL